MSEDHMVDFVGGVRKVEDTWEELRTEIETHAIKCETISKDHKAESEEGPSGNDSISKDDNMELEDGEENAKDDNMYLEDGEENAQNRKRKLGIMIDNGHFAIPAKMYKRTVRSLTKPSYLLGVGSTNLRWETRGRLHRLLCKLVGQHNWEEASGVLSMLLKGTSKEKCPTMNRFKYTMSLELLKRIEGDDINPTRIKHIYDIWMRKIRSKKDQPIQDRFLVHMEFILFCLAQGNVEEAHHAALSMVQENEFRSYPMSYMMIGLTSCQMWYSSMPEEMRCKDSDQIDASLQNISEVIFSDQIVGTENHEALGSHEAGASVQYDSDTSVRIHKEIPEKAESYQHGEASVEDDVQLHRENSPQVFQTQDIDVNSDEEGALSDNDVGHVHDDSVFYALGRLDSWLLPLRFPHSNEITEDFIYMHLRNLNDHYKNAVKYLRLALHSTPPVLAALLPLIQLLLIGGQVDKALNELEEICGNSDIALPFRLRVSILECFDRKDYVMLSTSLENILKRDPTCSHTVAKLVLMHRKGDYGLESLLEMIALHLDATFAECNTWREFAICFLKLTQYEEDRMSGCLNEDGMKRQNYSACYNRFPKVFLEHKARKAWRFRCRWWLTRHFSKSILKSEIEAGDLQLLAYKAACATHMYGQKHDYVVKTYSHLENEKNMDLFQFLQMHMECSTGLYPNLQRGSK
ncbi:hypothetical protein HS088_TW21G00096 [Tripterygium wilfordii]|uniref:Uncharacterized protein n=1 Tax=Tripterygium wilfordii TaxID=458696 RepID=A0A7J7C2G1_TRIWF|nr:uncharacterized protein LOC119988979 [Tripterygium wilfordii]XP_038690180.1 uncharacterized protein LOC119988979 [Tripterygium wilfordii]KAF5727956.1 hypothetical protein HS088_TW21G00096 [Tripterygium wilfordii]